MNADARILVTGASGLVGPHVLAGLSLRGAGVIHAVAGRTAVDAGQGVAWHRGDLLDADFRRGLVEEVRPTHLLHLAWYAEHGKFWNAPVNLDWLTATTDLLRHFGAMGGKRFVGVGSCAEYDWKQERYHETETPLNPSTLYGACKASAYLACERFAAANGLEFAWGRIFLLFGPHEAAVRIVPALIRAHLRRTRLECSQGTQKRDFLPVQALGDAIAHLALAKTQGPVNLGSGEALSLRDLSARIADLAGSRGEIRFGSFRDDSPDSLLPDLTRLLREVGWKSPLTLNEGLSSAIAYWRGQET